MWDRITRVEVMASTGTQYLGILLAGDYRVLRVAAPADWYLRLPGKRTGPHYERIRNLMVKARALRMRVVPMGPRGYESEAPCEMPSMISVFEPLECDVAISVSSLAVRPTRPAVRAYKWPLRAHKCRLTHGDAHVVQQPNANWIGMAMTNITPNGGTRLQQS